MSGKSVPNFVFLGEISVTGRHGELTPKLGKKAMGLLAYLSLSQDGAGRDEIAGLLWPDPNPSRSKHNLRQCLLALRQVFGDEFDEIFEVSADRLALIPESVAADVRTLLEIAGGRVASTDDLLGVCTGSFLRGLITRSQPFDQWVSTQRDRLFSVSTRVLQDAVAAAEATGRAADAARLATRLDELEADIEPTADHGTRLAAPGRKMIVRILATAGALVIAAGLILTAWFAWAGFRSWVDDFVPGIPGTPPRIAVLHFNSVNDTSEETNLASAVTLGVNFALYAITAKELYIVTSLSPAQILSRDELKRVARNLKVRYLITGSVSVDGDTVRIDTQRLDTKIGSGDIVRRQEFAVPRERAFELQDEITLWILKGLHIDVSPAEWERIKFLNDTNNLDAWLAANAGLRHLILVTRKDAAISRREYLKALDLDENYIGARRGLAWTWFLSVRLGWADDPRGAMQEAIRNLEIVLASAADHGTTQSLLGAVMLLQGKFDEAIAAGERARELLPGSADVAAILAHTLTYVGRHDEALVLIDDAMDLSPMYPAFYRWAKGRALRLAGQVSESIEELEKDHRRGEPSIVHLVELASSYSAAGRMADARAVAAEIRRLSPQFTAAIWLMHPPINIAKVQQQELKFLTDAGL